VDPRECEESPESPESPPAQPHPYRGRRKPSDGQREAIHTRGNRTAPVLVASVLPVNFGFVTYHHQRRLNRALYHLNCLQAEVDAWLDEQPHRTWTMTEADDDGPKKYFYCQVLRKPPSHLSLIIGDCLHNLRSALDNLAFELVLEHKQGPLSKGIVRDSAFPILSVDIEQDAETMKRFKRMTRGMSPGARKAIEALQPYTRKKNFASHPLWQLNELSIRDKHRLPPVASVVNLRSVAFGVPDGIELDDVKVLCTFFEGSAALVCYPAFDKTGAEVNIDFLPDFSVGFGRLVPKELLGRQIPEVLRVIHWYINGKVFPCLEPYLQKDR
jgi:hypothetical protein